MKVVQGLFGLIWVIMVFGLVVLMMEAISDHFGMWDIFAFIIVVFFNLLALPLAAFCASSAWDWPWWQSIGVFMVLPPIVTFAIAMIVGSLVERETDAGRLAE